MKLDIMLFIDSRTFVYPLRVFHSTTPALIEAFKTWKRAIGINKSIKEIT